MSRSRRRRPATPHVLVIVQNLPVPLDRRVWLECQALRAQGYDVSVICPKGPGDPAREVLDGVHLYKYRPPPAARGLLGYALEFVYCWLRTALLSLLVWRARPFQALQACNPPDTYWLLARLWKRRGVRFVFDHHDLNPELFLSRFGTPTSARERWELRALTWLERQTFHTADRVISTNDSYRGIALTRGGCDPASVKVVRSGPETRTMRPIVPDERAEDDPFVLAYLGIMGPQDGVDTVLDVMEELVGARGRRDVRGGCRPVPGREVPAERRLDHEQDDGVHGLRAALGLLRPHRDARVRG
jgi:glycosyltransferase involved in cell wall biosynthesis